MDRNKKLTIILSVVFGLMFLLLIGVMSYQFATINKLQNKLDDLQTQLDEANDKLQDSSNGTGE